MSISKTRKAAGHCLLKKSFLAPFFTAPPTFFAAFLISPRPQAAAGVGSMMLVVMVGGLASIFNLTKEVFPTFPTEAVTITVPYPGS